MVNDAEVEVVFTAYGVSNSSKGWYRIDERTLANLPYKAVHQNNGILSSGEVKAMGDYGWPATLALGDDGKTLTCTEIQVAGSPPVKGNTIEYGVRIITGDTVTRAILHRKN